MGETTLSDVIGDAVALVEAARADVSEDGGIPGAQPPSWTTATCAAWRRLTEENRRLKAAANGHQEDSFDPFAGEPV